MAIDRDSLTLRHIRDVEDEVLKRFSCGRSQLDEFLFEDARDYDAHGLTSTVIVFAEGYSAPAAYFSLTADSVHLSSGERADLGLPFDVPISFYPAVKITKLAVMSELQRSGIGDALIDLICGIVSTAPFAVRLLTVDAVNQDAVLNFYQRTGFIESLSEKKERQSQKVRETILMFKDLYQ
jgi:ribosomal protein S18 acetylase RimI-like enzyme